MLHAIATDLDGTLLGADHSLSEPTKQTLRELSSQGVKFIIATGRHFLDVRGIREVIGVDAYLITSNGARVHDGADVEIFAENVEPDIVRALLQPEFTAGTLANLYIDEGWLVERECPELIGVYYQDSGFSYQVADLQNHSGEGVAKVLYIAEHETLLRTEALILERFGDEVYVTFSAADCLEVMAPTVSKGHALTEVLARLRVDREHCVAFGDGQNDITLLEVAGQGYIMANASPKLKAAHPEMPVIGSNAEHGVAVQLRKLFGLPAM
ncbi:Cof-type HAD-IIB family hydrolase [Chitinilyticum piscinae]|uniref:Cof-type HAD-IIB family hydrolase n=1 Tax=Chitinilyticum piscinae TaxID=2866724 RepID=A0A8J7FJ73_9NEIS|nr:Cof-type HAD-IIB family hydrolase [Chitinilyticum piscinae]MBE9608472.1 Cof-type HAD-IIB family hydrolase [Chitinilyticum piscinae]